jgi:hypothetical protein
MPSVLYQWIIGSYHRETSSGYFRDPKGIDVTLGILALKDTDYFPYLSNIARGRRLSLWPIQFFLGHAKEDAQSFWPTFQV